MAKISIIKASAAAPVPKTGTPIQAIKADTGVILNGRGANSHVAGVLFADDNQQMDYHTKHHHKAGDTYSNLDFKVVLKDKSNIPVSVRKKEFVMDTLNKL